MVSLFFRQVRFHANFCFADLLKRVAYVTVNSLPRNALVEWQVVALKNQNEDSTQALTLFNGEFW